MWYPLCAIASYKEKMRGKKKKKNSSEHLRQCQGCVWKQLIFGHTKKKTKKNTTTPPVMPSLHSSVLHTDSDTSDVTACCEITSKCGKESTLRWVKITSPPQREVTAPDLRQSDNRAFSFPESKVASVIAAPRATVWHVCKCSSVAKGQFEPVWRKKKKKKKKKKTLEQWGMISWNQEIKVHS